ncbi:dynamin family protein [Halobacillus sp. Marseille-Q1614]|uniref:dynamin family protein n=1 Tax=Halobacillus sp. Marseille-Q1614 TaxID=2709134 RepID=UPI00156DDA21|nr:dynamin family protein [Halobacillus sp. Marseille-Q1614]
MGTSTTTEDKLLAKLTSLYKAMEHEYPIQAGKLLDLINKRLNQRVMIGFAGHFSAGKSTMINHLMESDILPSSPIPTSANIVHLSSGDPKTTVYYNDTSPEQYEGEIDLDVVRSLCRDGDSIKELDISRPIKGLPEYVSVLDTPGVDSTNDADRVITESSLHLMDYLYYVMDYNHVQSEVNLGFLLEMQKRATPFSIIINMVDKHNEEELTFDQFKDSVRQSLNMWGIDPEAIFFTSLVDKSNANSQFHQLQEDFQEKMTPSGKKQGIYGHTYSLIEEGLEELSDQYSEQKDDLHENLKQASKTIAEEEPQGTGAVSLPSVKERFNERVYNYISNAYLMPSEVREEARTYLEAKQPNFKVGWLGTKKKTEEERENRFQRFSEVLNDTLEKNLVWPLKERLSSFLDEQKIMDESLLNKVQRFAPYYPKEQLDQLVESGASVTGEYVLRYTDQLAKDIQKFFRQEMQRFWSDIECYLEEDEEADKERNSAYYQAVEEKEQLIAAIEEIEAHIQRERERLEEAFHQGVEDEAALFQIKEVLFNKAESIQNLKPEDLAPRKNKEEPMLSEDYEAAADDSPSVKTGMKERAEQAIDILQSVEGLESLRQQLTEKKQRLDHRSYTIALFGAFSAGKSSFANALLGESILPVSPNPTTATINKISAPTEKYEHKTVVVKVKSEQDLLEDLFHASDQSLKADSLDKAYDRLNSWREEEIDQLEHKKRSFIAAFTQGYQKMSDKIDQETIITWNELSSFVSEEKTSCFIEWVHIYYECEWTNAGVTLVDTPGADSVNARHTDVSFEYIKDADAILFVTYYNHPFSKADQSFLTQLGRVKDSFEMDKMFFIINAADLASSQDELTTVENYLQDQLQQFQIRKPRIFSLSSLNALRHPKEQEKGFMAFEERFSSFLKEELTEVLHHSMHQDIKEAVQTLEGFIEQASLDEDQKQKEIERIKEEQRKAEQVLNGLAAERNHQAVQNKTEKQLHYVSERLMLNYHDYYKNQMNPAVIKGTKSEAKKNLRKAAQHLLEEIEFEMNQEIRAVSIRMESFIKERLQQQHDELELQMQKIRSITLSYYEWERLNAPVVNYTLPLQVEDLSSILAQFKGTKSFFEQNEKEKIKDQLADRIKGPLIEVVESANGPLNEHYQELLSQGVLDAQQQWKEDVQQSFNRLLFGLQHTADTEEVQARLNQLKKIV